LREIFYKPLVADGRTDRYPGQPATVNELAKSQPIEWFERVFDLNQSIR
jgi:hypothetical protein